MRIKERSTVYSYSISVCMGSFIFGYELSSFSSLNNLISNANPNETPQDLDTKLRLLSCVMGMAAIFGILLYRFMIKSLGWLQSFKLTDYLTIFSALVGILNLSIGTQIFSRLLFGLVVGINTIIIPTYLTSVLPGSMGGPAGTLNQLFITIGIFFGFFMSFLVIHDTPTDFAWRLLIGLPILPALIRLHTSQNVYPYESVESMIENEDDDRLQSYIDLLFEDVTIQEFKQMKRLPQKDIQSQKATFFDPVSQPHRRRLLMACSIVFFNQLSGGAALGAFGGSQAFSSIFGSEPVDINSAFCYLNLLQIIVTLFSGQYLEKYGRRAFMMQGQKIIIICLLLIGVIELFVPQYHSFTVILIFIQMVGFSLCYGPCSFLIGTQILHDIYYPSILLWVFIFVNNIAVIPFIETLGVGILCLIYFVFQILGYLYISGYLVETQGRARKDVYEDFRIGNFPNPLSYLREKAKKLGKELEEPLIERH